MARLQIRERGIGTVGSAGRGYIKGKLIEFLWFLKKQGNAFLHKNCRIPDLIRSHFTHSATGKQIMEYHRTKDILHVKQLLGHRCLESTLLYTQLVSFEGDDYHVKTAKTVDDACELAKCGFEYFTAIDGIQIFRKRK